MMAEELLGWGRLKGLEEGGMQGENSEATIANADKFSEHLIAQLAAFGARIDRAQAW